MGQAASSALICRRIPELKLLIWGLDAAGKTSILYRLKTGDLINTIPTGGFNVECVSIERRAKLTMWDIGGRDKMRSLHRHFFLGSHGVLYIVDGVDRERLSESMDELTSLCRSMEDEGVGDTPVAVLCNKLDLQPETVAQICKELPGLILPILSSQQQSPRRAWRCFVVSAATGEGLTEAIEWLIGQALHELPIETTGEAAEDQKAVVSKTENAGWGWRSSLYSLVKSVVLR